MGLISSPYRESNKTNYESYSLGYRDESLFRFVEIEDVDKQTLQLISSASVGILTHIPFSSIHKTIQSKLFERKTLAILIMSKINRNNFRIIEINGGYGGSESVIMREYNPDACKLYIDWVEYNIKEKRERNIFLTRVTTAIIKHFRMYESQKFEIYNLSQKFKAVVDDEITEYIKKQNPFLKRIPNVFANACINIIKKRSKDEEVKNKLRVIENLSIYYGYWSLYVDICQFNSFIEISDRIFFAKIINPISLITYFEDQGQSFTEEWKSLSHTLY